ncbi:MAG: alanine:cation symporter family protein [Holosporaceae bacterium]|jgi:Na+/alanine symporter|nr:alanine:cation symporter family protein [Holosporaceae bacterium]
MVRINRKRAIADWNGKDIKINRDLIKANQFLEIATTKNVRIESIACSGMKILARKIFFLFLVVIGPFFKIDAIFMLADIVTGLMAIPNLIGLIGLRKVIVSGTAPLFMKDV